MSDAEVLSDDDRQLLDHIDDQIEDAETTDEYQKVVENLRERLARHQAEFRKFQHQVMQRLDALEQQREVANAEDELTDLEWYTTFDEDEREAEFSTPLWIAVTLHENWHDMAWELGGGSNYAGSQSESRHGVDTKTTANAKYNPSKLKHRLRTALDEDLEWTEIHRGLKQLAALSGGEEVVDSRSGRVHVRGGLYEYREKSTVDGSDVKRVVWRSEE